MEQCTACGRIIGNHETPHLWGEDIVCGECRPKMGSFLAGVPQPPQRVPRAAPVAPSPVEALAAALPGPASSLRPVDTRRAGVSWGTFAAALLLAVAVSLGLAYVAMVRPLQVRAERLAQENRRTADALGSLAGVVNRNADAANKTTQGLVSLTDTVNHNADAANHTTQALARDLDSLTETVNHNARIANINNSFR